MRPTAEEMRNTLLEAIERQRTVQQAAKRAARARRAALDSGADVEPVRPLS